MGACSVTIDDRDVPLKQLEQVLDAAEGAATSRLRDEVAITCSEATVLRRVLRGRLHSTLPVIVTTDDGRARGLIDDPELINGILEKRGHTA